MISELPSSHKQGNEKVICIVNRRCFIFSQKFVNVVEILKVLLEIIRMNQLLIM